METQGEYPVVQAQTFNIQQWARRSINELISSGFLIKHQDGNHGELHPRNKDFISSGVKFITAKHIRSDGTLALNEAPCISTEQASGLRVGHAQNNDVLLAHNATVGPVGLAPFNCEPFVVGTSITIYRSEPSLLLPEFLLFALKSEDFQQQLFEAMKQTTRNQVPITRQRQFMLPVPTLDIQKRIAAILNRQMEAVEKARQNAIAQLEAAKELPTAYLRDVFNSSEAQHWDTKKLGEVADIVAGITLGNRHNKTNTRSIPYLRVANVKDGYLDLADVYQIEATETEIEKLCLRYGDILLTEGGDPDKLGRGTFWQEQIAECIHQNHIFRVRFDFNEFCPKFISAQIGSPYGKAYFLAHAKQTTGIATINRQVLSNFPLLVPSLFEQKRIAASISEKLTQAERLFKTLEEQLEAIKKLPASLLRQAFNGEL